MLIPADATVVSAELVGFKEVDLQEFAFVGTYSLRCYKFAQMAIRIGSFASEGAEINIRVQVQRNTAPYSPVSEDPLTDKIVERLVSLPESPSDEELFVNLDRAGEWRGYPLHSVSKIPNYELPHSSVDYLIITSKDAQPLLSPLLDLKHSQGLNTFVMTTQAINDAYLGTSLEMKTREFLRDAFSNWHIQYVLIVGGQETLPPISHQVKAGPPVEGVTNDIADYYYMTLDMSPDDFRYRDYTKPFPMDFPDFVLGRFPSDNLQELESMIRKTVSYESDNNPAEWVRTNLYVQGIGLDMGSLWNDFTTDNRPKLRLIYPQNLTLQSLVDVFDDGVGSVVIEAHGGPSGWALNEGESLDFAAVDRVSNSRLPVIFSGGCHTGKFDSPESVAVKLLGKPDGGAVAILASTWFTPYEIQTYFSAYNYEGYHHWPDADYHVGNAFFFFTALSGWTEHDILLGDPSLVLATAHYDLGTLPKPQYQLTISVDNSSIGTTNPKPGYYSHDADSRITVSATANPGYELDHWEVDGRNVGSANPYTVTMDAAHTLKAFFRTVQQPQPPPPGPRCVIVTATYGTLLAGDAEYTRYVRDGMIGSTPTGRTLINTWNAFYYLWSPWLASMISQNEPLKSAFRVLLLPLLAIVHLTAISFVALTPLGTETASVFAFSCGAALSIAVYVGGPMYVIMRLRRSRSSCEDS